MSFITYGRYKPGKKASPGCKDNNGYRVSTEVVRAVWAYVTLHPRASTKEIGKGTDVRGVGTVASALRVLEDAGYISRPAPGAHRVREIVIPCYDQTPQSAAA